MRRRGLIITGVGAVMLVAAFLSADAMIMSDLAGPAAIDISTILEGMFDMTTDEIRITSGESVDIPYHITRTDMPMMWAVQIIDYRPGDRLSITPSDEFGDSRQYSVVSQNEEIKFEVLEPKSSDIIFSITNAGDDTIGVVLMIAEDPESGAFNPDSPVMSLVVPLAVMGFMLLLGLIVMIVGVVIVIVDLRRLKMQYDRDSPWR